MIQIIHSITTLQSLTWCPRRWKLESEMGYQRSEVAAPLIAGHGLHLALEKLHSGSSVVEALFAMYATVTKELENQPQHIIDATLKRVGPLIDLLPDYEYHWKNSFIWKTVATEFPIRIPIPKTDDILCGRLDMLVYDERLKSWWVVEHKSSKDGWSYEQAIHDFQFKTQLWIIRTLWPYLPLAGLIVNVVKVRSKYPVTIKSDGSPSLDRSKPVTLFEFDKLVENPSGAASEYRDWIASSDSYFQRIIVPFDEREIERTEEQLQMWSEMSHMILGLPHYGPASPRYDCAWSCDFYVPCSTYNRGGDAETILKTFFIPSTNRYPTETDFVTPENSHEWLKTKMEESNA